MEKVPVRRTQQERREETIGKLLQATIDSMFEVGYARTTVAEICQRAGVSHGGLFRHFPSLIALVIAAAEEVSRRQLDGFAARFAKARPRAKAPSDQVRVALTLLRDACRARENTVFYELLVAARTDPALKAVLEPLLRRYYEAILAAARGIPEIKILPPALVEPLVFACVHYFDGESLVHAVVAEPAVEDARLDLLAALVTSLTASE